MIRLFQIAAALAVGAYLGPTTVAPLVDVQSQISAALEGDMPADDWGVGTPD